MSFHHQARVVTDGLLIYLDAMNPKSFTVDSSFNSLVNGYEGLLRGTITSDSNSIDFKAGNGGIYKTSEMVFGANPFSVGAFYKVHDDTGVYQTTIASRWNTGSSPGTNEWALSCSDDTLPLGKPGIFLDVSVGTTYSCFALTDNVADTWYYVVGTRDGSTLRTYLNGEYHNSTNHENIALAMNDTINHFYIAGIRAGTSTSPYPHSGYPFNGHIGIIQVYNRVVTGLEVTQNWNALRSRYGL